MKEIVCGAAPDGLAAVKVTPAAVAVAAADRVIVVGDAIAAIVVPAGMPGPVTVAPTDNPAVLDTVTVVEAFVVDEPANVIGVLVGVKAAEATAATGVASVPLVLKVMPVKGVPAVGTNAPSTVRYVFQAFVPVKTKYSDAI